MAALSIPQPKGQAVTNIEDGVKAAAAIGYPVLVRPSFVLGGRAMQIVAKEEQLRQYLKTAVINEEKPVLVDHYIRGKEVEIDGICDGQDVFVPGIMELVERTGVHSGDSISVYPSYSISDHVKEVILDYTRRLGLGIGIRGLFNIQFIVDQEENVYISKSTLIQNRSVFIKSHRLFSGGYCDKSDSWHQPERAGHRHMLSGRKEFLVCKSARVFFC